MSKQERSPFFNGLPHRVFRGELHLTEHGQQLAESIASHFREASERHPPHKYCPKCRQWRDMDGECCAACGTALVLRQLNDPPEPAPRHDDGIEWGDLGNGASICHDESWGMDHVGIHTCNGKRESVVLTVEQFQRVLEWGAKNREELQRRAKEQE